MVGGLAMIAKRDKDFDWLNGEDRQQYSNSQVRYFYALGCNQLCLDNILARGTVDSNTATSEGRSNFTSGEQGGLVVTSTESQLESWSFVPLYAWSLAIAHPLEITQIEARTFSRILRASIKTSMLCETIKLTRL